MSDLHDAAVEAGADAMQDDQRWLDKEGQEPHLVYLDANPVQAAAIAVAAFANNPKFRAAMREVLRAELSEWEHYDRNSNEPCVMVRTAVEVGTDAILRALGGGDG